jgi:hypothetical protein
MGIFNTHLCHHRFLPTLKNDYQAFTAVEDGGHDIYCLSPHSRRRRLAIISSSSIEHRLSST